jgi:Uma2 family endonuclease
VNGVSPDKDPQFKDFCQGPALVLQGFGATTMVGPMQVLSTYRFTVDEYHRFGEAGILGEDDRVELLNGDLITMAPIGGQHRTVVDTLNLLFARLAENDRYRIGIQNPVSLNPHSEPQPDVALYAPAVLGRHPRPEEIFLLIEVADTSLNYDLGPKLEAYARAGIPEVWVIDAIRRRVLLHRKPDQGQYQTKLEATADEAVNVEALPEVTLPVSAFLGSN